MKVDENYKYDELEGFEPVKLDQAAARGEIQMVVSRGAGGIRLTKAASDILLTKAYIRILYNRTKKLLLMQATNENDGESVIRVTKTSETNINCANLCRLVAQECKYDLSLVNLRIPGEAARSRKGAVIFDLNKVRGVKPKGVGKKHGKEEG